jgi:hypothetical protein
VQCFNIYDSYSLFQDGFNYEQARLIKDIAMLQKLKVTSYALIILLLLVLPSQAVAQCNTQDACAAAAQAIGLELGGNGYAFSGSYQTKGCYSYESGKYQGMAYFGTGGSPAQMEAAPAAPKYRISCGSKKSAAPMNAIPIAIKTTCHVAVAVCVSTKSRHKGLPSRKKAECMEKVLQDYAQCNDYCMSPHDGGSDYYNAENYYLSIINDWRC